MPEKFERRVYLNLKSRDEARQIFLDRFLGRFELKTETLPVPEALDRITARPVFARLSSPGYHSAAMDGIAVWAENTYGASTDNPKELAVGEQAVYVNTGHPLPEGTNAVIMIEQVDVVDDITVRIEAAAYPWQHVRKVGEDIVATEMILPHGRKLGPYEMGALVASGITEVEVMRKPKVAVIPTGTELLSYKELGTQTPEPGQLVEYNTVILSALVRRAGGEPTVMDIIPDEYDRIVAALKNAVEADFDMVIINAGSSAGSKDYTVTAVGELGEVLVHGVTIMPGKPTILADIGGKPVIGNPGYPVSSVISFEQFAAPLLAGLMGTGPDERPAIDVIPSQALPSKLGLEEFLRVKLGRIQDRIVAVPLPRGAGSITTLSRADGVIRIPADHEGVGAEEQTQAELLRPLREVEGAIIAIGSHDNTLDLLGDLLTAKDPRLTLSSGNVGSLGGLLTLKRGFSHIAGSHLLDTETGDYNVSYIKKHLNGIPVRLVNLVFREQGFIVLPGNPKNIKTFEDLAREGVSFINRQAGSGTRILLDYNLKQAGINPDDIAGYESDEYTHMAVAVAVLSGRADAGLAVYSSAKALNLDFVPVTRERYDLVIPESYWPDLKIQTLLEVIRSKEFAETVQGLGGYDTAQTGELLWTYDGRDS